MSLIIKNLTFTYDRKNKNAAPLIDDFSAEFSQDRITAVSYTHPDVYKRQI